MDVEILPGETKSQCHKAALHLELSAAFMESIQIYIFLFNLAIPSQFEDASYMMLSMLKISYLISKVAQT